MSTAKLHIVSQTSGLRKLLYSSFDFFCFVVLIGYLTATGICFVKSTVATILLILCVAIIIIIIIKQRHMGDMGRDCCPHAGCFLCGTKCGTGRKGSGDRCREEVCQVYSSLSSSHIFIPVADESLGPLADDAHRFISERDYVTFAICYRNSVCLSSVCLWRWCALLRWLKFSAFFYRTIAQWP